MGKVLGAIWRSTYGIATGFATDGTAGAARGLNNFITGYFGGPAAAIMNTVSEVAKTISASAPSTKSQTPSVFRQSASNSFIIYGKRRAGGLMIFFHPVGKDFRYFVIAVAGHQCKGVTRWFLNDEEVTVDGTGKVTSGTYANNAWLWFARGTDDQAANSTFVAETQGKWTANHRARGTALIYAKFKMTDAVVQAGMPNITAEIEGKDDILDYRIGTRGYTRNAALIFYDWMLLPREEGGFGAYQDEIDEDWVAAQANVSDEACALPGGGTEPRYELDCYITTGAAPSEVRDTLVACCAGSFTYSGGKMLMRPGYYVPPSATLSEDDLNGAINVPALLAGDQIATEMTGTYIDPDNLYQPRDAPTRSVDSDDVRQSSIDLPHITSGTRAQRILEIALRKSQAERRVTWPMNIVGIGIATLDTVQLATTRYGLSNYSFQVTSWGLSQDFSVVLQLEETGPEIFEFTPDMYGTVGATGELVVAEPIDDRPGHAAYELIAQDQPFPVTSDDDSIMIGEFQAVVKDGIGRMTFPAGQVDGLASGIEHVVLYALADYEQQMLSFEGLPLLGAFDEPLTTTIYAGSYVAVPSPALNEMASSSFAYIRRFSTTIGGVAPPTTTPPAGDGGNGSSGGGNCVTVESLVLLADGSWKRAGDLARGDMLRTQHEVTMEWGDFPVSAVTIVPEKVMRAPGHPDATPLHRFWHNGWTRMEQIGAWAGVADVARITVEDAHTYVARHLDAPIGVLSHNIKMADPE